jgi:hypothetical protein
LYALDNGERVGKPLLRTQVYMILNGGLLNEISMPPLNGRQQAMMAENRPKGTPIRFEMVKTLLGQV